MENRKAVLRGVSVALGLLLGVSCWTCNLDAVELGQSQWIGFTQDNRPAQWAARNVSFNRPPADIATWKPTEPELRFTCKKSYPSPLLRRQFEVSKPVQLARIAICRLGLYELYLNGAKVGDRVLDPAQTSYDKRAFVVVHDVTRLLRAGSNAVGAMLSNVFCGQNISFGPSGLGYGPPRARPVIEITQPDGSQTWVESDASWKAAVGPVLYDNIYLGETSDARRWQKDWSEPGFDDSRGRFCPMYERVFNHYHNRKGLEAPSTWQAVERLRAGGGGSGPRRGNRTRARQNAPHHPVNTRGATEIEMLTS